MEERHIITATPESTTRPQPETGCEQPGRKVQSVELAVFLFLIVPSMATSFSIESQSAPGFATVAILSILSDLGLISLVFYFIWRNREPLGRIGWNLAGLPKEVGWGLLLFLPVMFSTNLLESALHAAGLSAPSKLPSFLAAGGRSGLVLAVVLVVVVALVEETIFRGYLILRLKTALRRTWAAVILSAFIFSIGHGYEGMAGVISIFYLGIVFALIYLWRRSLVATTIIHFLIDFIGIVVAALLRTNP